MKYLFYVIVMALVSCKGGTKETEQQQAIDSLQNVIKEREDSLVEAQKREERQALENTKIEERNTLSKKVYVDEPSYDVLLLGGIKNIRFTLFNDSRYYLDQVVLKVHYIKANGSETNTEIKTLNDVGPKAHLSLTASNYTSAGKKLEVTVEKMSCKAIDLCYTRGDTMKSTIDPYKCQ